MSKRKPRDRGNVYWKNLPQNVTVEDRGSSFIARFPSGDYKLIYWSGEDAKKAQSYLQARADKEKAKSTLGIK